MSGGASSEVEAAFTPLDTAPRLPIVTSGA
jgi:hypothetical protein